MPRYFYGGAVPTPVDIDGKGNVKVITPRSFFYAVPAGVEGKQGMKLVGPDPDPVPAQPKEESQTEEVAPAEEPKAERVVEAEPVSVVQHHADHDDDYDARDQ
jgi:hypothetical protein